MLHRAAAVLGLAILFVSCDHAASTGPGAGARFIVGASPRTELSGLANRVLAQAMEVKVLRADGQGAANVVIRWVAETTGTQVVSADSVTGKDGVARAYMVLAPHASQQRARAEVADTSFEFLAHVTPVVTLALPFVSLRAGESTQLRSSVTDSAGTPLQDQISWQSGSSSVAVVAPNGAVNALAPGKTEITASVGTASSRLVLTVTPPGTDFVVEGHVAALSDADLSSVEVEYFDRTGTGSAIADPAGRFRIHLAHVPLANDTAAIYAHDRVAGRWQSVWIPIAVADLSKLAPLLMLPQNWTIERGAYKGIVVSVNVERAFFGNALTPTDLTFWNGQRVDEGLYRTMPMSWPREQLPLATAFDNDSSIFKFSAKDSAEVLKRITDLNAIFGAETFHVTTLDSARAARTRAGGSVLVRLMNVTPSTHQGTAQPQLAWSGRVPLRWGGGAFVSSHRWMTESIVKLYTTNFSGQIYHEFTHAIGAGHGCGFSSMMNSCSLATTVTAEDVAYIQLLDAAVYRSLELNTPYTWLGALMAARFERHASTVLPLEIPPNLVR